MRLLWIAVAFISGAISTALVWDDVRTSLNLTGARLVVISDVPVRHIKVTVDGIEVASQPRWHSDGPTEYAMFREMHPRRSEYVLAIQWTGPYGDRRIERVMRKVDGNACLFVLRLDPAGQAVSRNHDDPASPIWGTCDFE